jgi:hypothetical protein
MIDMTKTFGAGGNRSGGYLPDQTTTTPTQQQPYGPDPNAAPTALPDQQGGQDWDYDPYQNFTMDAPQAFPFPDQWAQASNYFQNLMGSGVQTPWQYGYGSDQLRNMIGADGQPVDIQGYADAQLPLYQTMMEDMTKQSQESAGLSGTRWSSTLGNQIAEQGRRLTETYGADIANKWMQAQEAGMQRKMGGLGMMLPYGQATANLGLQNTQNQMYGASALQGIGSDYLYAPMNIAGGMSNLGNSIYNQQAGGINQFQNDPWAQMAYGLSGQPGSQQYPQTYQPSFASSMFGLTGAALPFVLGNQGDKTTEQTIDTPVPPNTNWQW